MLSTLWGFERCYGEKYLIGALWHIGFKRMVTFGKRTWNSAKESEWCLKLEGLVLDWRIASLIIKVGIINLCAALIKKQIPF